MTPLIRSVMRLMFDSGLDPTDLHWFDATGCIVDKSEVNQDPLTTLRPPFDKCMVCFEGKSTNHERIQMHMCTVGTDQKKALWCLFGERRMAGGLLPLPCWCMR